MDRIRHEILWMQTNYDRKETVCLNMHRHWYALTLSSSEPWCVWVWVWERVKPYVYIVNWTKASMCVCVVFHLLLNRRTVSIYTEICRYSDNIALSHLFLLLFHVSCTSLLARMLIFFCLSSSMVSNSLYLLSSCHPRKYFEHSDCIPTVSRISLIRRLIYIRFCHSFRHIAYTIHSSICI